MSATDRFDIQVAKSARELAEKSVILLVPMSGGVVGAQTASLTFMFGASGSPQLVDRVTSILLLMGKKAWHLGVQGAGLSGKLANNYPLANSNIATAEAMNLGIKSGLDPKGLSEMINSSTCRFWSSGRE
ncbi:hypothetical protein V1527DRAFT_515832 [Lipomyces starkeyi]